MAQSAMISKVIVFVIATARLDHMRKTGSYAQDWFICARLVHMREWNKHDYVSGAAKCE